MAKHYQVIEELPTDDPNGQEIYTVQVRDLYRNKQVLAKVNGKEASEYIAENIAKEDTFEHVNSDGVSKQYTGAEYLKSFGK